MNHNLSEAEVEALLGTKKDRIVDRMKTIMGLFGRIDEALFEISILDETFSISEEKKFLYDFQNKFIDKLAKHLK